MLGAKWSLAQSATEFLGDLHGNTQTMTTIIQTSDGENWTLDSHPRRIIVKFKDEKQRNLPPNAHLHRLSHRAPIYAVQFSTARETAASLKSFRKRSDVEFAEPDYRIHIDDIVPNDPYYYSQWSLQKIGSSTAWETHTDSSDVVVGILDTGVDYTHPDLQTNLWTSPENPNVHGYTCMDGEVYEGGEDDNDHGTHVSGIIAAATNNGIGISGINWKAKILSLKFIDSTGNGYVSDAVLCIQKALELKQSGVNLRVTNNSWSFNYTTQALEDAFQDLGANNVLNVIAAGNNGQNIDMVPAYPASFDDRSIISVMATDQSNTAASFSAFARVAVDIAAPGVSVLSTVPGGYAYFSGTSMATPHVAGVAASLFAMNPALSSIEARDIILDEDSYDALDMWDNRAGETTTGGILNHSKAVNHPYVQGPVLNQFPVISVTPPITRLSGQRVDLSQIYSDADGDTMWTTWLQNGNDAIGLFWAMYNAAGFRYETHEDPMSFVTPSIARNVTVPYTASIRDGNGGSARAETYVNVSAAAVHGQPPQGIFKATPDPEIANKINFHYQISDPEGAFMKRDSNTIKSQAGFTGLYYLCCMEAQSTDFSGTYSPGVYRVHFRAIDRELNLGEDLSVSFAIGGYSGTAPVAAATLDHVEGLAPFTVSYDANGSYDPDGSIAEYFVACGRDHPFLPGATGSCTYEKPGPITIRVLVRDNDGYADHTLVYAHAIAPVEPDDQKPVVTLSAPLTIKDFGTFVATASDDHRVSRVEFYKNGTELLSTQVAPSSFEPLQYSFTWDVHLHVEPGKYSITAKAYDDALNSATSNPSKVTVLESVNVPSSVQGPDLLVTGQSYFFQPVGLIYANSGDRVEFRLNWGDGTYSSWIQPFTTTSHFYSASGNYTITAQARCSRHPDTISEFGGAYPVEVIDFSELNVVSFYGSTKVYQDRKIYLNSRVQNNGILTTSNFDVQFYLSTDNLITTSDALIGSCNVDPLVWAATFDCKGDFYIPQTVTAGEYFLGVIVDANQLVEELDELGNIAFASSGMVMIDDIACLFCDDFEDQDVSDWLVKKGPWLVTDGDLQVGTTTIAEIVSPDSFQGCSVCSIQSRWNVSTYGSRLYFYGWQKSKKNRLTLSMDKSTNKWVMKHESNGRIKSATFSAPVKKDQFYDFKITFDGQMFHLFVDGLEVIAIKKAGDVPSGKLGFRVKSTDGNIAYGRIETIEVFSNP